MLSSRTKAYCPKSTFISPFFPQNTGKKISLLEVAELQIRGGIEDWLAGCLGFNGPLR